MARVAIVIALVILALGGTVALVLTAKAGPDPVADHIKSHVAPTRVGPDVRDLLLTRTTPTRATDPELTLAYLRAADWSGSPRTPTDEETEFLFAALAEFPRSDIREQAAAALAEMVEGGLIAPGDERFRRYTTALVLAALNDTAPQMNADATARLIELGGLEDPDLRPAIEQYFLTADEGDVPYADGPAYRLIERSPEDFERLAVPVLPENVIERLRSQAPPPN